MGVGKAAKLRAARRAEETRRDVAEHSSVAAVLSKPGPPARPASPVRKSIRELGGLRAYLNMRSRGYPVDHRYRIFALLIRTFRASQGITQAEAARRYGVSRASWSLWECGKAIPQPHILDRLSGPVSRMMVRVSDYLEARRRPYDVDENDLLDDEPLPVRRGRPALGRAAARRSRREVVTRAG
jgi:transcriptional regulator with XRE-family HTH domain